LLFFFCHVLCFYSMTIVFICVLFWFLACALIYFACCSGADSVEIRQWMRGMHWPNWSPIPGKWSYSTSSWYLLENLTFLILLHLTFILRLILYLLFSFCGFFVTCVSQFSCYSVFMSDS
jgi:hypothetical protein